MAHGNQELHSFFHICHFRDRLRLQKKFQKQFGVRQKWDQKSQVDKLMSIVPLSWLGFAGCTHRATPLAQILMCLCFSLYCPASGCAAETS